MIKDPYPSLHDYLSPKGLKILLKRILLEIYMKKAFMQTLHKTQIGKQSNG
jgi:hypothetical protein